MAYMFYGTTKANPDVSKWDTSNVINMKYMFAGTTKANPDVSKWNHIDPIELSYLAVRFEIYGDAT